MSRLSRPRRVAWLAAGCTLAVGLAACTGSSPDAGQSEAPLPTITGNPPVTLEVFAPQDPEQDLKTNAYTALIKEKFNITINWQTTGYDTGPAKEKRQISLASGDYPDLFLLIPWVDQFSQSELLKFSKQGVVLPLNQLIDQYAPNIKKAFEEVPEYKAMATSPDGKIYGLPQWNDCFHCSYGKLWINGEWLKKLGLQMPKTTEDMRQVLQAFKTRDPNGNGKADEVPLSANTRDLITPFFMNAFVYDPTSSGTNPSTLVLNNDKVDLQANKDGWREGLRYIKSLYDQGLIDRGAFTQNEGALKQLGNNAGGVILGGAPGHPGPFVTLDSPDGRDRQYEAVPPLTGPNGANFAGYNLPSTPGGSFVLTNKATPEKQIQAIKMLDHMFTDEGKLAGVFGPKGAGWIPAEPGDVAVDKSVTPKFKKVASRSSSANDAWSSLAQFNFTSKFRLSEAVVADPLSKAGYERRLFDATKLYEGKEPKGQMFPYWKVWVSPENSGELATLQTNIESFVQQHTVQFVTGAKNLDSDWDAYIQGVDKLGLKRYLQLQQESYDKSRK